MRQMEWWTKRIFQALTVGLRELQTIYGLTDGSRRESAAFGWPLRGYNTQGKTMELVHNKGCLGQYETAFEGEMEAIADIMEFVNQNEIRGDLTIHSDFVCNHIVFSHVVAMTNYQLPSPAMQTTSLMGRIL
jgi:hypothetical protein